MKSRYFIISTIAAAFILNGNNTFAQNTNYLNCKVTHKAGMWYDSDYNHPRTPGTTNPDSFDDSEGMKVHPFNNDIRIQKVHESIDTVYITPGKSKTITIPSTRQSDYSSMRYYQRWYNYRTDGNINNKWITPKGDGTRYQMADGVYTGRFLGGVDDDDLSQVTIVGPETLVDIPYYLGCDLSDYTDMKFEGYNGRLDNGESFTEPTLGQRLIYVIIHSNVIKNKINKTDYYEKHDIHFPSFRTSNNTPEQVSLNMAANNYFIDGEEDCGELTATIDYNGWAAGSRYVYLVKTITEKPGDNEYGDALDNGTAHESLKILGEHRKITFMQTANENAIPDGQVIYINVEKNGYKIAQFKITFDKNTQAIEKSEIDRIEKAGESDPLYHRTNKYLDSEESGYTMLANLNFDFDNVTTWNDEHALSGIRFYPYPLSWEMSSYGFFTAKDSYKSGLEDSKPYAEWGQYAITNGNGWKKGNGLLDENSKYHLYVDANQYPGTICELPFNANFCRSAKLFVTAWVKCISLGQADANILFILKGKRADGTSEIIHTHSSGQVTTPNENYPWHQIYFEFTSPDDYNFEEGYTLELYNNSAAATGADFCIDDIRVYLSPLQVNANITTPLCSSESEADVDVDINYELLLSRIAIEEKTDANDAQTYTGYYSFINKTVFDRLIAAGTDYHEAFAQAVVHGKDVYQGSDHEYFGTIKFSDYFNNNNGQNGMANSEGHGSNRRLTFKADVAANNTSEGFVTLVAGDEYYIVFTQQDVTDVTTTDELAEYYEMNDQICGIRGTFTVEGSLVINVDGDVQTDAATVCIGQQPLVDVEMRDNNGHIVEDAVFDWYFGSIIDFRAEQTEEIQTSTGVAIAHDLQQALERFRINYPDATSISDNIVPVYNENDEHLSLYQEDIDLIKRLNEDYSVGGLNPKLTLSASRNLSIRLMQTETYVVLIPIGEEPTEAGDGTQIALCWEPTQMLLHAQDGAPLLDVGRKDANYSGAGDYAVKVRIGKLQYDNLNNLQVPVRNPRLDDGTPTDVKAVDNDRNVYLNWTDDPRYFDDLTEGGYAKIIGTVNNFTIRTSSSADGSYVLLSFNRDGSFEPREGYHYSVAVRFTTTSITDEPDCYGNLVVPLVIVPDYEVWVGKPDGNWNDDSNWRRAEPAEIKKTTGYMTNDENGTSTGYVPLGATRVVIPTDNGVKLYTAEQLLNGGGILDLDKNKGELSNPTTNIEYDLTAAYNYDLARFVAGLYNTNKCYQIHFDADGQMLNSHLLAYERAWTNVEVPAEQWTIIATPLQGVFTGDWYTKTTGKENAEYFTDITFGNNNDRLQPYVLQRSWNGDAYIGDAHTDAAHTSNVTWSSTYNAVDIQTQPGEGFSILASKGTETADNGNVEFRLPKWDEKYDGFTATFERLQVNSGLLFSDFLKQNEKYSVTITPSHDGKYLIIGNPFTSSLDMNKFFEENTTLDKVYWTAGGDPLTAVESNDNWLTSDGQSTALVPPYTAFYARQTTQSASPLRVTFSRDMAVMPTSSDAETQSLQGMTLLANNTKGSSTALLRYDIRANNGFADNEDVQLMTESTGVTTPMVYTVAGSMATNINQLKDMQRIPLGLFANNGDVTTLTFTGVDALLDPTLYDAELNTETPITEGMELTVNGESHGRYFICSRGAGPGTTGISEVGASGNDVSVYSVVSRQVVISSVAALQDVSVYTVGGALLKHEGASAGQTVMTMDDVESGVAIVRVKTDNGTFTRKITVK